MLEIWNGNQEYANVIFLHMNVRNLTSKFALTMVVTNVRGVLTELVCFKSFI